MRSTTLYSFVRNSAELNKATRAWTQDLCERYTHHVVLATNQPVTASMARGLLRKWDAALNSRILGGRGKGNEFLHSEWVAYLEGSKSHPHWHLAFRLCPDLKASTVNRIMNSTLVDGDQWGGYVNGKTLSGLAWLVHSCWRKYAFSGSSKVDLITDPAELASYITKEQFRPSASETFVLSREFKA